MRSTFRQSGNRQIATFRILAVLFYACGIIVCLLGFWHFDSNMEDVMQWLPDDAPDRDLYEEFTLQFGIDDFLVVTWPGCSVSDDRCETFARALKTHDQASLIQDAISGRHLVETLAQQQRVVPADIIARFRGIYFGEDGDRTCIVVTLTKRGMENRRTAIQYVKETAWRSIRVPESDLILAGYPQMGAIGDALVKRSIRDSFGTSCLISTLAALICLRSFRLTIVVLATGGLAAGLSIALVTLTGSQWGGLSSVIPTLAYILSISGGLHLVNYAHTPGNDAVLFRVLRIGWKPCLLSAVTTMAGMLSLCRSEFPAIREFGLYCAGGVFASLLCQLVLIPVAVDWLSPQSVTPEQHHAPSHFLGRLLPKSRWVVALFILATALCGIGLKNLRSNLEVERNFSLDSPMMRDIAWFEKEIGPVDQTELLITFRGVRKDGFTRRLQAVRATEEALARLPSVRSVLSLAAWLPERPQGRGVRQTVARTVIRKQLLESRDQLSNTPYLNIEGDRETWRLSVRFPFLASTDFGTLRTAVSKCAADVIAQEMPQAEVVIRHTGVSLLYHIAQEELIADLYRNFALAFVIIFPLMILALRSLRQGVVAMIPNVCPAVLTYGALGWLNFPLDIGMAIAACVALGIAVDDTIHFMLRFREAGTDSSITTIAALNVAFRQCSRSMIYTTVIAGLGLAAFLFGDLSHHDTICPVVDRNAGTRTGMRPAAAAITHQDFSLHR